VLPSSPSMLAKSPIASEALVPHFFTLARDTGFNLDLIFFLSRPAFFLNETFSLRSVSSLRLRENGGRFPSSSEVPAPLRLSLTPLPLGALPYWFFPVYPPPASYPPSPPRFFISVPAHTRHSFVVCRLPAVFSFDPLILSSSYFS